MQSNSFRIGGGIGLGRVGGDGGVGFAGRVGRYSGYSGDCGGEERGVRVDSVGMEGGEVEAR